MTRKFQLAVVILVTVVAVILRGSAAKTVHVVGGSMDWTIPPPDSAAYTTWAASNTFTVGDSLVFNFANGMHDVAEVTKADYDVCNSGSPISIKTDSPANFTLNSAGQHFFICTFGGHCNIGQKLEINVSADLIRAPTVPPTPAPALHAGPAPRGPVTYTVGDSMGWTVPPQGAAAYQAWASSKTFAFGDILVFNFIDGTHDAAEVTKSGYDSCNTDTAISYSDNPPVRITLTTPGPHYFTCTVPGHCFAGQQLAITVAATSSAAAPPPSDVATPPSSKASPPPSIASSPPPSSTGSAPLPSTGAAPSPSRATPPPPSYIATPPSASAPPTPSAHSPSGAPLAPGPSPPLPRNAAASLNANRFSKTAVLSQLGVVLAVGFVQQLFM